MFASLILVGTVHQDPLGTIRLSEFFQAHGPDCILLELSRYGLDFREKNQVLLHRALNRNVRQVSRESGICLKALMKHPQVASMRRQMSLPFEFRASRHYSLATGTPVFLIDRSHFSRGWIRLWPELISPRNLHGLVAGVPQPPTPFSLRYEQAARLMGMSTPWHCRNVCTVSSSSEHEWVKRERHLARKTARILANRNPRRPVFVGGWEHLVRGGHRPTLRDYLGVQEHQCTLLDRVSARS